MVNVGRVSAVSILSLLVARYAHGTALSNEELKHTYGGAMVDVTSFNPNARIPKDNIYIQGDIEELFVPPTGQVVMVTDIGNGKSWGTTIATPAPNQEGEWVSSMLFPLNQPPAPVTFRICNTAAGEGTGGVPCTIVPQGEASIANIDVRNNTLVRGVRFWQVQDGNQAAFINPGDLITQVDWSANGNATDILDNGDLPDIARNMDWLYENDCGINERLQFRYAGTLVADATNWGNNPGNVDYTIFQNSGGVPTHDQEYIDHVNQMDPNGDLIHVFIVNDIPGATIGIANNFDDNIFTIEDAWYNAADFDERARLLAHELGHTQSLRHVGNVCNGVADDANVMCAAIGIGGDRLDQDNPVGGGANNTQCFDAYNSTSGVDNLNQ